jgi:S-adenosylmethionine hydrolase
MTDASGPPIITLLTDFGLQDAYVGAMKGAALGVNPHLQVIDISHSISPQAIRQACFIAQSAWPYFPPHAVHVAVVDPGVGTERRAIAIQTDRGTFVGPDNGVLSSALPDDERPHQARAIAVPANSRVVSITNARYLLGSISATFHGRDVFAPAAAHLASGVAIEELGEAVPTLTAFPPFRARRAPDGTWTGQVVCIDRFGNLITDCRNDGVGNVDFVIEVLGRAIPAARTYAEANGLAAIAGSTGYIEVVLSNGSAAAEFGAGIGTPVVLRPAQGRRYDLAP